MSEQGTGDQAVDEYDGDLQWIKMKISVGVLRHFITRDDDGNRLILSLKGPDKHGFFEGTVTTDYDDNLFSNLRITPEEEG